jgi:hypothetical protein
MGLCLRTILGLLLMLPTLAAAPARAGPLSLESKLDFLARAYPDAIAGHEGNLLLFRDGGPPIEIDDGKAKDHFEKLEFGDIEDSLSQAYPAGGCQPRPGRNEDPGRIRSDALMKRLYGQNAKAVAGQLVSVRWFGEILKVTPAHGVAKALAAVAADLEDRPDLRRYLAPSAGVFNWRKVSGASNLSVHSFGAAIDLNTKFADYWVWAGGKPGRVSAWKNQYPMDIVEAFERHGFIWGGRWYHYDSMHFEYRPELLAIGRAEGVAACK